MPFFRQRPQGFCEQLERWTFTVGSPLLVKKHSFHPDEIADVEQPKKVEQFRADLFRVNVN